MKFIGPRRISFLNVKNWNVNSHEAIEFSLLFGGNQVPLPWNMYIGNLQEGNIVFSQTVHSSEIFSLLEALIVSGQAFSLEAEEWASGTWEGDPYPWALFTSLHHPLPHWLPRSPTQGWACPSLQRPRYSKRMAKTRVLPGELSSETRLLPCSPERIQWKMPQDWEPRDPAVPPAKLHNCGHTSSFVHKLMTDGNLDPQEGSGNREKEQI